MSAAKTPISLSEARQRARMKPPIDDAPPAPSEGVVPLGHDRGVYFYLSRSSKQIVALKPDQHTRLALASMASTAHFWERQPQWRTAKGIDWSAIADHLMASCRAVGIYDPDIVRGRGAWIDNGRSILHLGDRLIVDGAPRALELEGSRFVYEAARTLKLSAEPPLDVLDARKLLRITAALRWARPVSGKLLAGWIAIAPICGALAWRPAVWLTGGRGSGKSWCAENIILPALGPLALTVQSVTSEAGIRQELGSDARPVVFDEAEREDHASAVRMQAVLALMRQSSSETGAKIVKGSANQSGARKYQIRSTFLFQSINVGLQHQADESRVTVLALREPNRIPSEEDVQAFADLKAWCAESLTPQFSAALISRMTQLIPVVRASAEVFAQAIAATLGSRRLGDQLGTLLAGAWMLQSDEAVTPEKAREIVEREEFQDASDIEDDRDETRCLRQILTHRLPPGGHPQYPVSRLIEACIFEGYDRPPGLPVKEDADRWLRDAGLKVERRSRTDDRVGLFVSVRHPEIARALRDTPWASSWSLTLARLPDAEGGRSVFTRFASKTPADRAVWMPIQVVTGDDPDG